MATRHVLRALVGAAAGPHLPERETYRLHHHSDPPHTSSEPALLQARLLATLAQHTLDTPWSLPSHAGPLSLSDLAAALVSPVDAHRGPLHATYLPAAALPGLCARLSTRAAAEGRPLDVCEQLEVAMSAHPGRPLAAGLLLHCLARVLARGQDRRLGPQARMWLDERLAHGQTLAPFSAALRGAGDPLGDLTAYWGSASAGMAATWAKQHGRRSAGRLLQVLFYAGPSLGGHLRRGPFGDHARVARVGLRHGLALGVATQRQLRTPPGPGHTNNARIARATPASLRQPTEV